LALSPIFAGLIQNRDKIRKDILGPNLKKDILIRSFNPETDRTSTIDVWKSIFSYNAPHNEPSIVIDKRSRQVNAAFYAISCCLVFGLLFICAGVLPGQQIVGAQAGLIHFIYGDVSLDGKILRLPEGQYLQMENGQSLRTEQGRVELSLAPSIFLRLDDNSLLFMEQVRLNDTRLALERGSALIEVVKKAKANKIHVRVSQSLIELKRMGVYRFDSGPSEFRVFGGAALVTTGRRKTVLTRGEMVRLGEDAAPVNFDRKAFDSLHEWAGRRSFDLFLASEESRKQMNWTHLAMGWFWNQDFQLRFHSKSDAADYLLEMRQQNDMEVLRQQSQSWEEMESIKGQMEQQPKGPAK